MKIVAFESFGGPEVLRVMDVPKPSPGPGQILVKVAAAGVNPTDLLMRSGAQAALMRSLKPPFIPGMEFAGTVAETGAEATGLVRGVRVMGAVDARRSDGGAYAEYIRVPSGSVAAVPAELDLSRAAALPMNGLTAGMAMDQLALAPGGIVLVTGGAGTLAGLIIALARAAGLVVVADASRGDEDAVRARGVNVVVPRGAGMVAAVRSQFPRGVDGAVDTARIGKQVARLVRDHGTLVCVRQSDVFDDARVEVRSVSVLARVDNGSAVWQIADSVVQGRLPLAAVRSLPFARAADAHRLLAAGRPRERVVLSFAGPDLG